MQWFRSSGIPLLHNVESTIQTHKHTISQALNVPAHLIKENLDFNTIENNKVYKERIRLLKDVQTPIPLVQSLFGKPKQLLMNMPISTPNYDELYRIFTQTPIESINPHHLNELIRLFTNYHQFKRPTALLNGQARKKGTINHGYAKLRKIRHTHLARLQHIFDEVKNRNLPLSIPEQNQFIYYSFFRDRLDIDERVERSFKNWGKQKIPGHELTFEVYKKIKMDDPVSLNNLLNVSLMQNNREIFDDIVRRIKPNRQTFCILLSAYSGQFEDQDKFFELLDKIEFSMDISVLNQILKGYINLGHIKDAEKLFDQLEPHSITDNVYKMLRPEDKQVYSQYLNYYDKLSEIIHMEPIKIMPNMETFTPLIQYYNHRERFDKVLQIVDQMPQFNLPFTTSLFYTLARRTDKRQALEVISRVISSFEMLYNVDLDLIPNKSINGYQGQFAKIPDFFIREIMTRLRDDNYVGALYQDLRRMIYETRGTVKHNDVYINNEINYMKYTFLNQVYQHYTQNEPDQDRPEILIPGLPLASTH